jgi:hypothetical protein
LQLEPETSREHLDELVVKEEQVVMCLDEHRVGTATPLVRLAVVGGLVPVTLLQPR